MNRGYFLVLQKDRQLCQIIKTALEHQKIPVVICGDDIGAAVGEAYLDTPRKDCKALVIDPAVKQESRVPHWEGFAVCESIQEIRPDIKLISTSEYESEDEKDFYAHFPISQFGNPKAVAKLVRCILTT